MSDQVRGESKGHSFGIGEEDTIGISNGNGDANPSAENGHLAASSVPGSSKGRSNELDTAHRFLRAAKSKIEELKLQLVNERESTARVKEEFQKYRIRSELARQQHDLEISKLSEVNMKFKQYNVVSHDVQAELEMLRRRFELVERERSDAMADVHRLNDELAVEKGARQQLHLELEKWKRKSANAAPETVAKATSQLQEELSSLRREHAALKVEMEHRLAEKDRLLNQARTGSDASTELTYLRDVVLKYLASTNDPNTKGTMEAALATVLRFTPDEVAHIKERRRADSSMAKPSSWKGALGL